MSSRKLLKAVWLRNSQAASLGVKKFLILKSIKNNVLEKINFSGQLSRLAYIPISEFKNIWDCRKTPEKWPKKAKLVQDVLSDFSQCVESTFAYYSTDSGMISSKAGGDVYIFCNDKKLCVTFRGTGEKIQVLNSI